MRKLSIFRLSPKDDILLWSHHLSCSLTFRFTLMKHFVKSDSALIIDQYFLTIPTMRVYM